MPAVACNSSQAMRVVVDALAQVYLPGFARAAAIRSRACWNGVLGPTFMIRPPRERAVTGIMSLSGSYGRLGIITGFRFCDELLVTISVYPSAGKARNACT